MRINRDRVKISFRTLVYDITAIMTIIQFIISMPSIYDSKAEIPIIISVNRLFELTPVPIKLTVFLLFEVSNGYFFAVQFRRVSKPYSVLKEDPNDEGFKKFLFSVLSILSAFISFYFVKTSMNYLITEAYYTLFGVVYLFSLFIAIFFYRVERSYSSYRYYIFPMISLILTYLIFYLTLFVTEV